MVEHRVTRKGWSIPLLTSSDLRHRTSRPSLLAWACATMGAANRPADNPVAYHHSPPVVALGWRTGRRLRQLLRDLWLDLATVATAANKLDSDLTFRLLSVDHRLLPMNNAGEAIWSLYRGADEMKLVTFCHRGVQRVGLLEPERVIDVNRAYAALLAHRGELRAAAMADALVPAEMIGILEAGERALTAIREAREHLQEGLRSGEQTEGLRRDGIVFTRNEVELKAPIPHPRKLILLGLNYRDHAEETGQPIPEVPTLFAKYSNSVVGPGAAILIPRATEQIDYEAEFAFVIGRRGHHIPREHALDYVSGYTIINDVSARDYQFATSQWMVGKTFDTHCPMGPALILKDEISDPHDLDISLSIGGEVLQRSNTRQLIFKIPETVEYLARIMTLEPGDVISTGTPAGVGFTRKPPRWLQPGETVRVEIAGLGVLENPVAKAP